MLLKTPDNSCETELDGYWFIITVLWLHIWGWGGQEGSVCNITYFKMRLMCCHV